MNKRLIPNRAKIHRNYTVEEIADLFGVHKNTVREWIKKGLPVNDDKRPLLVLGVELRSYIQAKRVEHKQKCKPCELYCLRCKVPQYPYGGMVDYEPSTDSIGRLIGICPICNGVINKFTSLVCLEGIYEGLDITVLKKPERISKRVELL
jgi:hypothetical protein